MPEISVITPVYDGGHHYLAAAGESVEAQRLPAGWAVQWVVQEDGTTGRPLAGLPDVPWITRGGARRGGAARARTLGLARATGRLVRALDADDLFPDPHALARDIETLTRRPDMGWCVSPVLDLLPDGTLRPGPRDPAPGPLPGGCLADGLRKNELPVVGTAMTTYTALVRLLGGWPALPATEDVGLLLAAEAVTPGWMQERPGAIYRKHGVQSTTHPGFTDPAETRARHASVLQRADALRASGWRWTPPRL
ncbi:glycosyltransferase [Streptomyces sp. RFCAC02]|uniref:glycosyltransferase n=1 Tax=Streptomyces sp. RFCAC02 TaxID=2499143 RepID=UPI0010202C5A|nr:glycosyltransferase [Streptomyces sp. RFCAC02]